MAEMRQSVDLCKARWASGEFTHDHIEGVRTQAYAEALTKMIELRAEDIPNGNG